MNDPMPYWIILILAIVLIYMIHWIIRLEDQVMYCRKRIDILRGDIENIYSMMRQLSSVIRHLEG